MKSYDISKIKFKSKDDPSLEQKLTGKVITELENQSKVQPNAELEGKEYIQFPDGTTQLAVGNKHEKGGIKMQIPDGTKVASNSLNLPKSFANQLKDEYGISASHKDTYASVITKYTKKIGLEDLYKEEEELYKLVAKQNEKKGIPESTRLVNQEYMSGKVADIEKKKQEKEKQKAEFFGVVFENQEGTKPQSKAEKAKNGQLKYGGVSEQNFKALCEKYGISEEQGRVLLGEKMPSFDGGGEYDELKKKYDTAEKVNLALEDGLVTQAQYNKLMEGFPSGASGKSKYNITTGSNDFSKLEAEKQKKGTDAFGSITKENLPDVMKALYMNFPDIVGSEDVFGVKFNEDGSIDYNKDLDFSKLLPQVEKFQNKAKSRMESSADVVINNPTHFSDEQVEAAKEFKKNETFDDSLARGVDKKLGQFTSGRFNLGIDVVTPEEHKALAEKGIFTVKQLNSALEKDPSILSDSSKERLGDLSKIMTDDSDFSLNMLEQPPADKEKPKKPEDEEIPEGEIDNSIPNKPKGYFPQLFGGPDQYPSAPYPMDAHLMGETRFQRMDPVRVGIEPQIQEAGEQRKFLAEQMFGNLSPNVAASVMANSMANQTKAINSEARAANMMNASNQASTELFNIGQAGNETQARLANLMSFEQRQFRAKANFQEEMKRWEDQLRAINMNNYKNNQTYNLLNQRFDDYNVGADGSTVNYDPNAAWELVNRQNFLRSMGYDPSKAYSKPSEDGDS